MPAIDFNPILWTTLTIAVAAFFQTVELLILRRTFDLNGIWRWNTLRKDFEAASRWIKAGLDLIFSYYYFLFLLFVRLLAAIFLAVFAIFFPQQLPGMMCVPVLILLISTIAISIRWRGTFNGGSDYMTIIILTGLSLVAVFNNSPAAALGCVYYITFHVCRSYFVSGLVKINSKKWRDGTALNSFITAGVYGPADSLSTILNCRPIALVLSWAAIIFEVTFPLALFNPTLCLGYLLFGFCFHLSNVYLLGLNRFLFAWVAAYPAIYWCSVYGVR